jgi:PAS domain S-box-containing protein
MDDPSLNDTPSADRRYRLLVDAITDYAIYMLDTEGRITNWNAGAQRFKGYTAEEVVGSHFSRFYLEEDRATGLPGRALHAAATEGKFEAEGWRVRKNGERFWAHIVIDPIRDAGGELIGYAKITRDLTKRKRAEQELRYSERQFRLLVQGVTDYAIYMLDPGGRVTSWNAGAERIKGYSPEEIIGQHFSRFYLPEEIVEEAPAKALEIARAEGRFASEGWRVRKDGTRFRASVVIDAIYEDDGSLAGFAKITRDVTEREEAQHALELSREVLLQSQKMEAIGQLTGGVAHDFNNLLMAILGSLELLRKRLPDNSQLIRLLDNAVMGAERGAALTQRMLAYARRQELRPERTDINTLVRGMTGLIERSLGPSWTIETRFPLNLSAVITDANHLEMALLNLVVNSCDAMPDGGPITIEARNHQLGHDHPYGLATGAYVCLSVRDQGEGMDVDTLARATEPFFTTKGVGKGTGLGLSMIQGFAKQLGGTFVIDSTLGEGTAAMIWLPAASPCVSASCAAAISAADAQIAPLEIKPMIILAIDDDALVLMNTAALLEDAGHVVIEASSADEALEIFHQRPDIELIVTDHAMPGMTGMQLAQEIRRLRPDFPIILATGYGELPADADEAVLRLGKPFNQADLTRAVADVLVARSDVVPLVV